MFKNNHLTTFLRTFLVFCILASMFFLYKVNQYFWAWGVVFLVVLFPRKTGLKILEKLNLTSYISRFILVSKKMYRQRFFWFSFITSLLVVLVFYHLSLGSYFEGDEWVFFRFYAPVVKSKLWWISGFLNTFSTQAELNVHMTPISNMLYVITYRLFGLWFLPYIVLSLLLHAFTGVTLIQLIKKLTKRKDLALATGLIFLSLNSHQQAVTWVVATLYTLLAVIFGMWSLIYLHTYLENNRTKDKYLSWLFVLLAMWSKETAIIFIPLYLVFYWLYSKKKNYVKDLFGLVVVFAVVVITQLPNASLFVEKSSVPSDQPWAYSLMKKREETVLFKWVYRVSSFSLKTLPQSLIHQRFILNVGIWMTNYNFPFFNTERSVQGTTYNAFTQGVMAEMVSWFMATALMVSWTFYAFGQKLKRKLITLISAWYLFGLVPILIIILKFPWWGYTSLIDSRHFYHITPAISFGLVLVFSTAARRFFGKYKYAIWYMILALMMLNYFWLQKTIDKQQQELSMGDRKLIIEELQNTINPVPEKIILYTTSDRGYYGFGHLMLPFQIAFSHMLPVLFSDVYHPAGQAYDQHFFSKDYLLEESKGKGLVTQGYTEIDGIGLGYYLEMVPMLKTIETRELSPDLIYAFEYNSIDHTFENITEEIRQEVTEILASREQFRGWIKHGDYEAERIIFETHPSWNVERTIDSESENIIYQIWDQNQVPILDIEIIENKDKIQFSLFVAEQLYQEQPIETNYTTDNIYPDYSIPRTVYHPFDDQSIMYLVAGNNMMFFKMTVYDQEKTDQIIRTTEHRN